MIQTTQRLGMDVKMTRTSILCSQWHIATVLCVLFPLIVSSYQFSLRRINSLLIPSMDYHNNGSMSSPSDEEHDVNIEPASLGGSGLFDDLYLSIRIYFSERTKL